MSNLPTLWDPDVERAVLGSCIAHRDVIIEVAPRLHPDDFGNRAHQEIYAAIYRLYEERIPPDLVTVSDELTRRDAIERVGGPEYLADLVMAAELPIHAGYYAARVAEYAYRRRMARSGGQIQQIATDLTLPLDEIRAEAMKVFNSADRSYSAHEWISALDIADAAMAELDGERRAERAVLTGYRYIDRLIGGFTPGQLVVIGARPSVGKSAFAAQVIYEHAIKGQQPVGVVSLEMNAGEVGARLIALLSRVNTHRYRMRTNPVQEERERVTTAAGQLGDGKVHLLRQPSRELQQLLAVARDGHARHGFECLIVDHIHLMSAHGYRSRYQEMSAISGALKGLAVELDIPVLALAQLNRNPEHRGNDAVPKLSDLRDSGTIEQDADIAILIHRQPYSPNEDERLETKFMVQKHRNGPTGNADMRWVEEQARFVDVVREDRMVA